MNIYLEILGQTSRSFKILLPWLYLLYSELMYSKNWHICFIFKVTLFFRVIIFFQKKEDQVFMTSHFDARDTKKNGYLAMTMLLPSYFFDLTSCGIWDFEMLFASISISIVYFEAKFSSEEISQIHIAVIRKSICYFYFHKHTLRKCTYILLLIYACVYYYLCIFICYY